MLPSRRLSLKSQDFFTRRSHATSMLPPSSSPVIPNPSRRSVYTLGTPPSLKMAYDTYKGFTQAEGRGRRDSKVVRAEIESSSSEDSMIWNIYSFQHID